MAVFITTTTALDSFKVDVMLEDTYSNTLGITDYPVEEGSNISDHAQILPKTYDLIGGSVTLTSSLNVAKITADYNALLAVQEKRSPFTVETGITTLKNMLIESFTVTRDKTNATVLFYKAHLKEVIKAGTENAPVPSARAVPTDGEQGGATTLAEERTQNKAAPVVESDPRPNTASFGKDQKIVDDYLSNLALDILGPDLVSAKNLNRADAVRLVASTKQPIYVVGTGDGG